MKIPAIIFYLLFFILYNTGIAEEKANFNNFNFDSSLIETQEQQVSQIDSPEFLERFNHIRIKYLNPAEKNKLNAEETEILLKFVVRQVRLALFSNGKELEGADISWTRFFSAEKIAGYCLLAQTYLVYALMDLGIPPANIHRIEVNDAFNNKSKVHYTTIIKMPDNKLYLIDPTFRQFFHPVDKKKYEIGYPGELLKKSNPAFAEILLKHGFVLLTNSLANDYGRAMGNFDKDDPAVFNITYFLTHSLKGNLEYTRALLGNHLPSLPSIKE